jgi:hypothetical protein
LLPPGTQCLRDFHSILTGTLPDVRPLIALGTALPYVLPPPLRTWLHGAGINIGWLFTYGVSIIALWQAPVEEPQDA